MVDLVKKNSIKILAPVLFVCLAWTTQVDTKEFFRMSRHPKRTRAPRTDAPEAGAIVTCPSSCDLSGIEDCVCSIKEDIRSTWTMIEDSGEVVPCTELTSIEDVNNAVYSITTWLKTLYAYNRGWFCSTECEDCDCSYPCP